MFWDWFIGALLVCFDDDCDLYGVSGDGNVVRGNGGVEKTIGDNGIDEFDELGKEKEQIDDGNGNGDGIWFFDSVSW